MENKLYCIVERINIKWSHLPKEPDKLLGFNLTLSERDKMLEEVKSKRVTYHDKMASSIEWAEHKIKFKNNKQAYKELVEKPKAFNEALALIKKNGCVVVEKGIVNSKQEVKYYELVKREIFAL